MALRVGEMRAHRASRRRPHRARRMASSIARCSAMLSRLRPRDTNSFSMRTLSGSHPFRPQPLDHERQRAVAARDRDAQVELAIGRRLRCGWRACRPRGALNAPAMRAICAGVALPCGQRGGLAFHEPAVRAARRTARSPRVARALAARACAGVAGHVGARPDADRDAPCRSRACPAPRAASCATRAAIRRDRAPRAGARPARRCRRRSGARSRRRCAGSRRGAAMGWIGTA